MTYPTPAFADTAYFIALLVPNDVAHPQATTLAQAPRPLITTAFVLTELAAYFAQPPNRALYVALHTALKNDPQVQIIPATSSLFDEGSALYATRMDKAWSLVDCISFVIMRREHLTDALTTDHHFNQAGFHALLTP